MKKNYLILILLLISCLVHAQDTNNGAFSIQMGDYHSPEVQALNRYGQIPVSYSTGAPQIDIPLYETDVKGFKFGISVSYNASGIKVDDIASVVGLGWVLNAGGVISRTVNGLPDETAQRGFLNRTITSAELGNDYYLRYMYNTLDPSAIDCAADEFTYNFMGYTGKFSFGTDGKVHLLPFRNLKIEFVDKAYFRVKTEEGHTFLFNETEKTILNSNGNSAATTAWHLTKIILSNNGGEIDFSYIAGASYEDRFPSYSSTKVERRSASNEPFYISFISGIEGTAVLYSHVMTSAKYLSEIKLGALGRIVFKYDDDTKRLDFLAGKILRSLKVYNSDAASVSPICNWEFAQKMMLCEAGYNASLHYNADRYRMFLSSISEVSDSADKQIYRMEYDPTLLPCRKSFGKDLWGYYNGKSSNKNAIYINDSDASMVSRLQFPSGINNDRKGNETYIKAGSLVRLTYPTGGYTAFEYEGHQISANEKAGGLRIKSIKNYTDGVLAESRYFKYGLNEDGLARISVFNYSQNLKRLRGGYHYERSNPIGDAKFTIYTLTDYPFYPSNIGYEYVTEYHGTESNPSGKTEYVYDFKMDDLADSYSVYPNPILFISNSWQNGNPKEIKTYAKTAGGYNLVRKETNVYKRYGVSHSESHCVNVLYSYSGDTSITEGLLINMHDENLYSSILVPIVSEVIKKMQTVVTDYIYNGTSKDSIVTTTQYSYNGLDNAKYPHDFITKTKVINSSDDNLETEYRYIADVIANPTTGHAVYKAMYAQNMISTPLEVITRRKGKVVEAQVNLFRQDIGTNIVPKEQKTLETTMPLTNYVKLSIASTETMDSRLTTNVKYSKFNSQGSLMEYSKRDKVNTVTLWAYNSQYPVIRIEGATYDDVEKNLSKEAIDDLMINTNRNLVDVRTQLMHMLLVSYFAGKPVLVTAYNYLPLVGMASKIAPNSEKTTYEYDNARRLVKVKDHNGKTVEQYNYQYKK